METPPQPKSPEGAKQESKESLEAEKMEFLTKQARIICELEANSATQEQIEKAIDDMPELRTPEGQVAIARERYIPAYQKTKKEMSKVRRAGRFFGLIGNKEEDFAELSLTNNSKEEHDRLKKEYDDALEVLGNDLYESERRALIDAGLTDSVVIDKGLAEYKGTEILQKVILDERKLLINANVEGQPVNPAMWKKTLDWYRKLPRTKRVLLSTALSLPAASMGTIGATLIGGMGIVGGLTTLATYKFAKSYGIGALIMHAARGLNFLEKWREDKHELKEKDKMKILSKDFGTGKISRAELEKGLDEIHLKKEKRGRNWVIAKMATGFLIGGLTAFGLTHMEMEAGLHSTSGGGATETPSQPAHKPAPAEPKLDDTPRDPTPTPKPASAEPVKPTPAPKSTPGRVQTPPEPAPRVPAPPTLDPDEAVATPEKVKHLNKMIEKLTKEQIRISEDPTLSDPLKLEFMGRINTIQNLFKEELINTQKGLHSPGGAITELKVGSGVTGTQTPESFPGVDESDVDEINGLENFNTNPSATPINPSPSPNDGGMSHPTPFTKGTTPDNPAEAAARASGEEVTVGKALPQTPEPISVPKLETPEDAKDFFGRHDLAMEKPSVHGINGISYRDWNNMVDQTFSSHGVRFNNPEEYFKAKEMENIFGITSKIPSGVHKGEMVASYYADDDRWTEVSHLPAKYLTGFDKHDLANLWKKEPAMVEKMENLGIVKRIGSGKIPKFEYSYNHDEFERLTRLFKKIDPVHYKPYDDETVDMYISRITRQVAETKDGTLFGFKHGKSVVDRIAEENSAHAPRGNSGFRYPDRSMSTPAPMTYGGFYDSGFSRYGGLSNPNYGFARAITGALIRGAINRWVGPIGY